MTENEKLKLISETLDCEDELSPGTILDDLIEWDSMAKLSLIVMMEEEFNKKISAEQVKQLVRVQDILDYMAE